jgi:hypothetical protein
MADEDVITNEPTAENVATADDDVAASAPLSEEAQKDEHGKNGGARRGRREDQKPVEELYDLSQPIPKVSSD